MIRQMTATEIKATLLAVLDEVAPGGQPFRHRNPLVHRPTVTYAAEITG